MKSWLYVASLLALSIAVDCGSGDQHPQGSEKGPCYPNLTCNAGLTCLSDTCVNAGGIAPSGSGGVLGSGLDAGLAGHGTQPDGSPNVPSVDVARIATPDAPLGMGGNPYAGSDVGVQGGGGSGGGLESQGSSSSDSGNASGGTCTPAADSICFANGQASGGGQLASVVSGHGWVAPGAQDTITSPTCADNTSAPTTTVPITEANPCPSTGIAVWGAGSTNALCMSGSIPLVTDTTAYPSGDYNDNWGLQIGIDISSTGAVLGVSSYSKITLNFTGSVNPNGAAIRAELHRKGDGADATFCAIAASGMPISLTAFSTQCWSGCSTAQAPAGISDTNTCYSLNAADIPNIDKIDIHISSDATNAYTVSNFCWTGITFDSGDSLGTGGAVVTAGAGGAPGSGGTLGAEGGGTGGHSGSGGTSGSTSVPANCSSVSPCGGSVVGTWKVASSCLTLSGEMDVTSAGLGCPTVPVTGSLQVSGTWTANADTSYADKTTTTGSMTFPLTPSCLTVSSVPVSCSKIGGDFSALGWTTACSTDANGQCNCSATANQLGGIGVISPYASGSGNFTTSGNDLTTDGQVDYSYCVASNTLTMTPTKIQGANTAAILPVTGSIVLLESSSPTSSP